MRFTVVVAVLLLSGCRGEPPPRDYQNSPPAATHPVTSSEQSPSAHGMTGAAPEPNTGVEGKNNQKPVSPIPATLTLKDAGPVTQTTKTTTTTPP